jgi:uncharacterized protein YggE
MVIRVVGTVLAVAALLPAQTNVTPLRGVIRAVGEGRITVRPDVARISFGVVTRAATANEAANANAERSTAMIAKLKELLGPNAEIRTTSYSVSPTYQHAPGQEPAITGFVATNQVEATVSDLSLIGRVIDAGIQAGANQVYGPNLGLKNDEDERAQALRIAGQKARAKAEVIAQGVGVRLGRVVAAQEGVDYTPIPLDRATTAQTAKVTPVETGTLEVRASVTLDIEVVQ